MLTRFSYLMVFILKVKLGMRKEGLSNPSFEGFCQSLNIEELSVIELLIYSIEFFQGPLSDFMQPPSASQVHFPPNIARRSFSSIYSSRVAS